MTYSVKYQQRDFSEVFYHSLTLDQARTLVLSFMMKEEEFSLSITYGEFNE